jgi:hypothetical protein
MEPWLPLVISSVIFIALLVVFRIARAYWSYSVPISFVLAVFCLVAMRRFKPEEVDSSSPSPSSEIHYIVDIWYVVEASILTLALVVVAGLLIVVACRANPQARCCVCFRLQTQMAEAVPYDSIIFHPTPTNVDVYVDQ